MQDRIFGSVQQHLYLQWCNKKKKSVKILTSIINSLKFQTYSDYSWGGHQSKQEIESMTREKRFQRVGAKTGAEG